MLRRLLLYMTMFIERAKEDGFFKTLSRALYSSQEAVPAYCDLDDMNAGIHSLEQLGCEIRRISNPLDVRGIPYSLKSRQLKVGINMRKGYHSIILLKDNCVIGDIWFTYRSGADLRPHADLKLLDIDLQPHEAYAFDLYVARQERGKDLATSFMRRALGKIREMGISRVYGFYMAKNIPALWIHRLIGYKELPKRRIRNILFLRLP